MIRWFLFIFAALFATAAEAATLKDDALSVTIGAGGVERIVLNGGKIVTAPRSVNAPRQGLADGAAAPVSSMVESDGSVTLTDRFDQLTAKYTWSLDGNDLDESIEIENRGGQAYGNPIRIGLPTFTFGADAGVWLPSWPDSYVAANQSYHPSVWVPLAAQYARDSTWGLCLHSKDRLAGGTLFDCADPQVSGVPRIADMVLYVKDSVPPLGRMSISVTMRITPQSGTVDLSSLLASYIRDYQTFAGPLQYDPDDRPLLQFAGFDSRYMTGNNPRGYNGANRRLDLDGGVMLFERLVSPGNLVTGGTIFWQPQGADPRGVEYRPDFDVWPGAIPLPNGETSNVRANLPRLIRWYAAHHLRFGLCGRPDDVVVPATATTDKTIPLDDTNPEQMAALLGRFDAMTRLGVNLYYLDSFGVDEKSVRVMRQIRAHLGRGIPTFSEYASDMMLPLSGLYVEPRLPADQDGTTYWYSPETLRVFRLLQPHSSILMGGVNGNGGLPRYSVDQMGQRKLTPLVEDFLAPRYVRYYKILAEKYMDRGRWK